MSRIAKVQTFTFSEQAILAVETETVYSYINHNPITTFFAFDHPEKVDKPLFKTRLVTKDVFPVNKGDVNFTQSLNAWIIAHTGYMLGII